jgi:glucose-6-phosphate isomerase
VSSRLAVLDAEAPGLEAGLERLRAEDVLGELLERRGRTAELATEAGDVKLSWVDQVAWALEHRAVLAEIEDLAASLRTRFRHLVWAGMGGSVQTVHTLCRLGLLDGAGLAVHPLDSTDPAALNRLLRAIGGDEAGTVMVAVAMGMTSEEPISHLRWFHGLLAAAGVPDAGDHALVMTLPGSYLDEFARSHGSRRLDIQPDGQSHTPGRMSAPSTRVFLLPAALALGGGAGGLGNLLQRLQAEYGLRPGLTRQQRDDLLAADPFARLAAWLSAQVDAGRDMVLLDLPERWRGLGAWIEQAVEESLGKGGRGLLVFPDQDLAATAAWPDGCAILRVDEGGGGEVGARPVAVLRLPAGDDPTDRLAAAGRVFAGWDLAVALVGRLQGITFAGQPAVEGYKRYARELRDAPGPLPYPADRQVADPSGRLTLYHGASGLDLAAASDPARALASACSQLLERDRLGYLDVTLNAEPEGPLWERLRRLATDFASRRLARPVKVRSGPRDYHSTEQSETDGPPDLLSLRILLRRHEAVAAGEYDDRFLQAQALGTMLAMRDAGRPVLLVMLESADDTEALDDLFAGAAAHLEQANLSGSA